MTMIKHIINHLLESIKFGVFMTLALCVIALSVATPVVVALAFFGSNPIALLIAVVAAIFLLTTTMVFFLNY